MKEKKSSAGLLKYARRYILLSVLIPAFSLSAWAQSAPEAVNLRTEYKTNPVGIDVLKPRLSWEMKSPVRNVMQAAYQVRAALDREDLSAGSDLIWNPGKIPSGQSVHVEYDGPPLRSGQRIYWQVRIWDDLGGISGWSAPSYWEMGLLNRSDWKASWIEPPADTGLAAGRPCPMLRKEFGITKKIRQARLYVTAHGLYQVEINGQKTGDEVFTPGWTSYRKRIQYQTWDVTGLLREGKNALGVTLGNGWYIGFPNWDKKAVIYGDRLGLLLQLDISYEDGSQEQVVSDAGWKCSTGPILFSGIYNGETYDARLEKKGWSSPGFPGEEWKAAGVVAFDSAALVAPQGPPVRKIQELIPVRIFSAPNGKTVADMGQNMVGWVRLKVSGPAGMKIRLRHGEVLDKEGNLYTGNLRGARQTIEYTLKGEGEETYEPHFTFQGFRYVEVDGWPGEVTPGSLTGIVIHSDLSPAGTFECSDSLVNRLQHNILWGLKGNFLDVPTDCPQRDERLGWTGDAQVFASTACFNVDAAAFYTKWLKDLALDQQKDGLVPHVIPDVLKSGGATGWADAAVIIPWTLYLCYGDTRILEEQYPSMKAWIDYMKSQAGDSYIWNKGWHWGDWLAFSTTRSDYPGATTDKDLIATAFFYHSTALLQKTATILGRTDDAEEFLTLMKNIRKAFLREFVTPNGRLSSNTQTAYVLALHFGLLPDEMRVEAARRLAADVDRFKHITTGFLGTPYICHVLSDYGYDDLAYMLLLRHTYPSWLYPVLAGATTIWERWDGIRPDGSFQDEGMNSFNHYAYGAIGNWLYGKVAGIQADESEAGYRKIMIDPHVTDKLDWAGAGYYSMYGKIASRWQKDGEVLRLQVSIPPNTTARIHVPAADAAKIYEGGKPVSAIPGLKVSGTVNGKVIIEAGSGEYGFEVRK
jgi:alpha-L-rhamnosidase